MNSDGTVSVSNTTIDSDENPFEEEAKIGQDYGMEDLEIEKEYVNRFETNISLHKRN